MSQNIFDDLESLIKRASASKQEALKKESEDISTKLDNAEDGTSPASTGEQAAAQISAQKESYPDPAADVGAKDNSAGESVNMSSDEATAVSTDGQEGTEGGELASGGIDEADNGPEDTDSPDNNGFDSGSFKSAAAKLRKQAAALRKTASATLPALDQFLVKAARASTDKARKKTAQEMDDMALADAASDSLIEQLEAGAIGDDEAAQILEEAINAGAVSEEEIAEAAQAVGGLAEEPGGEEALMEAKLAAADIGPDHPEYLRKVANFYPREIEAGYNYGMKLAAEMCDEEEKKEAQIPEEIVEEAAAEGESPEQEMMEMAEVAEEEGEADESQGEEEGEVSEEAAVEGSIEEDLTPTTPEEEQALGAVGGELGLEDQALQQLLGAPLPPEAQMEMGKLAKAMKTAGVSPATRYRTLLLQKVAALGQ